MNVDVIQWLYYAGFALFGWWLRHRGLLNTPVAPPAVPAPAWPMDQKALVELLKSLLDRLAQAPASPTQDNAPGTVFHVPIEVAATPRNPRA